MRDQILRRFSMVRVFTLAFLLLGNASTLDAKQVISGAMPDANAVAAAMDAAKAGVQELYFSEHF
ncbi:MAG TPA: hypothetical protein EYO84_02810, partial [Planctomycetes bacterium]|nr:hypothetical protein [Planctomycetota bacterium]